MYENTTHEKEAQLHLKGFICLLVIQRTYFYKYIGMYS